MELPFTEIEKTMGEVPIVEVQNRNFILEV